MMKLRVLVLCLILFLCGCVKKDQSQINELQFATWGSASEMAILKPIIRDFEQENKNVKIKVLHIPQNYFQKIHLLFASNLAPDVIFINNLNLPVYANYLKPLSVDKSCYHNQALQSLSYNGVLYAVPRDISNLVIYYNKDLFDKYGVTYPKSSWTIKKMLDIAEILTTKQVYGLSYEEDLYYLMPYILTFNESIYPINNVKNLKSVIFYKDLVTKFHVAPSKADVGSKTIAQMFLEQKIAMHLSGRWLVPKYRESANFRWGVINFPGIVPCDASGWAISKSTKNEQLAKKFVEYLSSKENISKMTMSGLIVPARKDINLSILGDSLEIQQVFINAIYKSLPQKITPSYNKIVDNLNDSIFLNNR